MSRRPSFYADRARNPFRLLPPSQALIARAHRAGVDTTSRPAIAAWQAGGEPEDVRWN
jgi:DNA-binding helix-hairpin-helix protein with protein kinase domain